MYLDVVDLRDFYAAPVGRIVARQLSPVITSLIKVDAGTLRIRSGEVRWL